MKTNSIIIGDQHFKVNNVPEVDLFIERMEKITREKDPHFIVLLGDLLDQHEKIHSVPLNKAYEFIDKMRKIAPTYVLVGNHDMLSNQVFLKPDHWLNALKEWENVIIVDEVVKNTINGNDFIFCPYVFPGRFEEALDTLDDEWKNVKCIFCHQEFEGSKMGAIISKDGDRWNDEYPDVISGHIHKNQTIQNIYYPGSSMQVSFGETDKNIIAYIVFDSEESKYSLEEIDTDLPRKKIVYMDVDELETFNITETKDKIKITVSGTYEEFKTIKKTPKYKEIVKDGVQVVFKTKKKELKRMKDDLDNKIEEQKNNEETNRSSNFLSILDDIVKNEKNPFLFETFEYVINDRKVDHKDIIYV
jgi:DNA repair exonuclease SbcCD nuclease subunit